MNPFGSIAVPHQTTLDDMNRHIDKNNDMRSFIAACWRRRKKGRVDCWNFGFNKYLVSLTVSASNTNDFLPRQRGRKEDERRMFTSQKEQILFFKKRKKEKQTNKKCH